MTDPPAVGTVVVLHGTSASVVDVVVVEVSPSVVEVVAVDGEVVLVEVAVEAVEVVDVLAPESWLVVVELLSWLVPGIVSVPGEITPGASVDVDSSAPASVVATTIGDRLSWETVASAATSTSKPSHDTTVTSPAHNKNSEIRRTWSSSRGCIWRIVRDSSRVPQGWLVQRTPVVG